MTIILIVLIVLLLAGGIPAYRHREDLGYFPSGLLGLVILIVLIFLIFRLV